MPDQTQLAAAAWQQLAIIGGAMTKEDEITFDGTAWNIPAIYRDDLKSAVDDLARLARSMGDMTTVERTFPYRPFDGAYATQQMLKKIFGYVQAKNERGSPPAMVDISLGWVDGPINPETGKPKRVEHRVTVPFNCKMVLPSLRNGTLEVTSNRTPTGTLFHLRAYVMKMHEDAVKGFFDKVHEYLDSNSIYRGKAFNGAGDFIDTEAIDPDKFVFTQQVWRTAETNIFSVMRDEVILANKGMAEKRAVLLSGDFGGGKTALGLIAALVAVRAGWTPIFCRPEQDDPFEMIHVARLMGRALLIVEDIDVLIKPHDQRAVSKLLDMLDGAEAKNSKVLFVATTNYPEKIPAGMFRPGRFDTEIVFGAMDRPGVEKLAKIIIGSDLADDIDFDAVYKATDGYMPAFVREGLESAIRYSVSQTQTVASITTTDLIEALDEKRPLWRRQEAAKLIKPTLPPLDETFREIFSNEVSEIGAPELDYSVVHDAIDGVIESRVNGATIYRENGDEFGNLSTN